MPIKKIGSGRQDALPRRDSVIFFNG
jgi:hypothetical protein